MINENGDATDLEEKPQKAKSNYAVTGIYMYNNDVVEISKSIFLPWGELEITGNKVYLEGDLRLAF